MIEIANLEIHVAHGCNLTCASCAHYSNQGHRGVVALADAEAWMNHWRQRIEPRVFSLLGGEPTLHSQLTEFVALARRSWPRSHLRLVTNGFLLHRHPGLPRLLRDDPNAGIYLSIHHHSEEYQQRLAPVLRLLERWQNRWGIAVEYYWSHLQWTRRYHGVGAAMAPFADGEPRQSWENCPSKTSMQLYQGMLWKCPPLAYLPLQNAVHGLSAEWQPYLAYRPLAADCSDAELTRFVAREEESHCGMCPAKAQRMELPIPFPGRQALRLTEAAA